MADGRQLDEATLLEFAQERTSGHVFALTGVGAPVPEGTKLEGKLTPRERRLALEQSANGRQRVLINLSALDN
jgi:hypothetical protein